MNDENIVVKVDRHIEVVTTETAGMKETGFGSVETCRRVCDVLKSRYTQVHFNQVKVRTGSGAHRRPRTGSRRFMRQVRRR